MISFAAVAFGLALGFALGISAQRFRARAAERRARFARNDNRPRVFPIIETDPERVRRLVDGG